MYLAMHTWMRAEPIEDSIRRLPAMGYKAIEISGEPERHDPAAIRRCLEENDIDCFGAVTIMTPERSLLAKDPGRRAATVRYVKDCVTMVHELGGQEMSVVPGSVCQLQPEATPEQEWTWAVESLKECNAHAEGLGVRIGVEPINRFETFFINRADQAMALAEAVGDSCGVVLDTFHMAMEEQDICAALRASSSRLIDVHIGENNRHAPGLGSLDWAAIVQTLKDIGYDGPLSVEFCPPFDRTPVDPYPHQAETDFSGVSDEQRRYLLDHGSNLMSLRFFEDEIRQTADVLLPLIEG